MFIRHFEVKNFMVHRDTKVDLYPITVFVGANNGGKSAFFDALLNFSMVSRGRLSTAFSPGPFSYEYLKYHGSVPAARIAYKVTVAETADSSETIDYEVSYGHPGAYVIFDEVIRASSGEILFDRGDPDSYPMGETVKHLGPDRSIFAAIRQAQLTGDYVESDPLITLVARDVSRISKYRLDPSNLGRPSPLPDTSTTPPVLGPAPRLSYRGDGLAAVLYYLTETLDPALEVIIARCREIVEGFEAFEFNTVAADRIGFSVEFSDNRGTVPAANLSDGTLSCLGLVTLLLSPDRAPVVCIEEPENGLTPPATRAIYRTMQEFVSGAATGTPSQLLVSSHSPYMVCEAWNGTEREFIYQMRPDDGASLVRRFADIVAHHEIHLEKDNDGKRTLLNLRNAELILEGYLS